MESLGFWQNFTLLIGRILFASLFFQDAIFNKLMNANRSVQLMTTFHFPLPKLCLILVVAFELIAGSMLVLGWHARIAALLFALFCIVVSPIFHQFWAYSDLPMLQNQLNHFFKNLAIAGGGLFIVVFGAGKFSL